MRFPLSGPRGARRLAATAPLILAAVLLAPASPATAKPLFGVQTDGTDLAAVRGVGAQITRYEVSWAALEPTGPGQRDPAAVAELDRAVADAAAHGIKPILFFDRTPCWASAAPADVRGDCSGPDANRVDVWRYRPADPTSVVGLATFLAERYGSRIAALQIWNEPDQSNRKYWAGDNIVSNYVAMVKAIYPAVKAVAPKLPVLAGSFVGTDGRWLTAMYDAGIKGYYDGLAVQFYDLPLMALRTTHAVQRKYHDKAPLWLTEFGFTSCAGPKKLPAFLADHPCVTRAVQARDLADMVAALRRTSWVRATVVYAARDESTAYQFGLLDSTGRHKPSYNVVRKALRSRTHLRSGKVKLVRRRSGVSVFGDVPGLDLYTLRAYVHGTLRFRATLRTNRLNHFSLKLPAALGRHGLRVTLTSAWSHRRLTAR